MTDIVQPVIEGEFEDHEWRELAAKQTRSEVEERRYQAGPKTHPFGSKPHVEKRAGEPSLIFASKADRDAYHAANPDDEADEVDEASEPKKAKPAKSAKAQKDSAAKAAQAIVGLGTDDESDRSGPSAGEDFGLTGTDIETDPELASAEGAKISHNAWRK